MNGDWRTFSPEDKLRLYVVSWLKLNGRFLAVANDPERKDRVPNLLCLELATGELRVLPGDRYAARLESYLLLGDHPIDAQVVSRQARRQIAAALTAEERAALGAGPMILHDAVHHRLHQAEAGLIQADAEYYWLHGVNYPAYVRLVENSFYNLSRSTFTQLLNAQLAILEAQWGKTFAELAVVIRERLEPARLERGMREGWLAV